MSVCFGSQRDSGSLLVLAVTLAVSAARRLENDELGQLAAFLTVLGDVLALFALQPGLLPPCPEEDKDSGQPPR